MLGSTSRSGEPCERVSGLPSMWRASITSGSRNCSSETWSTYGASIDCSVTNFAAAVGRTRSMIVSGRMPSQRTSSTDQPVTQWKSLVWRSPGSSATAFQRSRTGFSTRPVMLSS